MKSFVTVARQGDLLIRRINKLPRHCAAVAPINGKIVVGHSETGHHHVMDADHVEMYRLPGEIYDCFLIVKEPTALEHLRSYDTHEAILHAPGYYQVRRQREYTPRGWQRVQD